MMISNINVQKGLVNGAFGFIAEIIWTLFPREQMYQTNLPHIRVDINQDDSCLIQPKSIQFPEKYSHG